MWNTPYHFRGVSEGSTVERTDLDALWVKVCTRLKADSSFSQYSAAFLGMTHLLNVMPDRVLVAVANANTASAVKNRLYEPLTAAFVDELQRPMSLVVTIDESLSSAPPSITFSQPAPLEQPQTIDLPAFEADALTAGTKQKTSLGTTVVKTPPRPPVEPAHPVIQRRNPTPDPDPSRLNVRYTFESFVTGDSNRLASSAARAVAENPASAYNPLFIYGQPGLGKTHLLHAIGVYALNLDPTFRVRYVNSEEFTNEFINSIRDDSFDRFQHRYRSIDFLLVDDIQFLSNKEETQEAFFHTFNALHNNNKQVVITSDLPPKQLTGFEDRMKSRFEWGLITDVQPPSLETRIAILRMKAQADNVDVDPSVLSFIAERVSNNIRNLEGALTRVQAASSLAGRSLDVEHLEHSLRDIVTDSVSTNVTVPMIIAATSEYYGVTVEEIVGTARTRKLVDARQIAMYISRDLTELSLPKIGAEFGNRDHSTVVHAIRKIQDRIKKEQRIFDEINELTSRLQRPGRR